MIHFHDGRVHPVMRRQIADLREVEDDPRLG
jgi:hypothetical protein